MLCQILEVFQAGEILAQDLLNSLFFHGLFELELLFIKFFVIFFIKMVLDFGDKIELILGEHWNIIVEIEAIEPLSNGHLIGLLLFNK